METLAKCACAIILLVYVTLYLGAVVLTSMVVISQGSEVQILPSIVQDITMCQDKSNATTDGCGHNFYRCNKPGSEDKTLIVKQNSGNNKNKKNNKKRETSIN